MCSCAWHLPGSWCHTPYAVAKRCPARPKVWHEKVMDECWQTMKMLIFCWQNVKDLKASKSNVDVDVNCHNEMGKGSALDSELTMFQSAKKPIW